MNTTSESEQERREHHLVRKIFDQACILLAPYVAGNDKIKTMSDFAMAHMIHDQFPELTTEQVHLIIMTVEKAHRDERLQAILAAAR